MSNPNCVPLDPNCERRSKFVNEQRRCPPTPPASLSDSHQSDSHSGSQHAQSFNSEVTDTLSGEYTDRAEEYAVDHFPITTRRMFEYFDQHLANEQFEVRDLTAKLGDEFEKEKM